MSESIPLYDSLLQKRVKHIYVGLAKSHIHTLLPKFQFYEGVFLEISEYYRNLLLPLHIRNRYLYASRQDFFEFIKSDNSVLETPIVSRLLVSYLQHIHDMISHTTSSFMHSTGEQILDVRIAGDIHPNHHTKLLIQTDKKQYIVYPAEFSSDQIWRSFFVSLCPERESIFPNYRVYDKIIVREYKEVQNNTTTYDDIHRYYGYLGQMAALFGTLRGIDLNYENVICQLPYPVFFDYECLLTPELKGKQTLYNIGFTGFMDIEEGNNMSLLNGGYVPNISYMDPILVLHENKPSLRRTTYSNKKANHIPYLNGNIIDSKDFKMSFLEGYMKSAKHIENNIDLMYSQLERNDIYTRIIARPTNIYTTAQRQIAMGLALGYTEDTIAHLVKNILPVTRLLIEMTPEKNFSSKEYTQILNGYIPSRHCNIDDTFVLSSDTTLVGILPKSPKEVWLQHIKNISSRHHAQLNTLSTY